jgi:hypothetical protein
MAIFSANGLTVTDNAQVNTSATTVGLADGSAGFTELPDQQVNDWGVTIGGTNMYVDEARDIVFQVQHYLATGGAINYSSKSGITVVGSAFDVGWTDVVPVSPNASKTFPGLAIAGHTLTMVQAQVFCSSVVVFCNTEPSI